jgi:nicotinamidase-related amidase
MHLSLSLRTRVEAFKGSGEWDEVSLQKEFDSQQIALLLCDMWNIHWCKSATRRCEEIVRQMIPVLKAAHARGVQIIHAPSDCMEFYKDMPQRQRIQEIVPVEPPPNREIAEPPLPVDASDNGCDDIPQCPVNHPWTRQHPSLPIREEDVISDKGVEVYSLLQQRGIKTLLIMGVHTNMCVLGRSFAIRQMTRWGVPCILVRDLTDTMYNPRMSPYVDHAQGTELVVEHIEKYWCPTLLSADFLRACGWSGAETA